MKYITIIWTIVLVSLVSLLTIFGFKYKEVAEYKELEQQMVSVSKEYFKVKNINIKKEKTSVNLKELLEFDSSLDKYIVDNCIGKVTASKIWIIKSYKSTIKCDNYKS